MSEQLYTLTTDLFGDGTATVEELTALVAGMDNGDQWGYELQIHGNEARMYATRYDSEKATPTRYGNWAMINYEEGYLVIAEAIEAPASAPVETDDSEEPEDDTFDRKAFYRQHPELVELLNPKFDNDETDDGDAFGNLADYRYENAKDK